MRQLAYLLGVAATAALCVRSAELPDDPAFWRRHPNGVWEGPWLGGFDAGVREWSWVTGEPWTYSNWAPSEPTHTGQVLQFFDLPPDRGPRWNDQPPVNHAYSYVLEYEAAWGCVPTPDPACGDGDCGLGETLCNCPEDCDPSYRSERCDDGSQPTCRMLPPVCDRWSLLAYQDQCYRCVNPMTCRPWGELGCRDDADCPGDGICDLCATSSCPMCEDCVAACVGR